MDEQSSGATESASTASSTASADVSTPSSQPQAAPTQEAGFTAEVSQAQEPYKPNYKFKALDKEHEFDEWARPIVTKDNEEKLRDLYTRAYGLDHMKPKYESMKEKMAKIEPEYTSIMSGLEELNQHLTKKDMGKFFERLKIPKENVMKWVLDELNYEQLPPDQKAQMEQQKQVQEEAEQLRRENQRLQTGYQEQLLNQRAQALDMSLNNSEVRSVAEAYEARKGQGAFKRLVIERGIAHYQITGEDLSPQQAVSEVVEILGGGQSQAGSTQPQAAKPVIPNVGGRTSSSAKKTYNSLEDIKKLANSL